MLLRLDLQFFSGEKTEKATPNKRREARKKGQIAKSIEVSSALSLLFSFSILLIGGKSFIEGCLAIFRQSFQEYMLWELTIPRTQLLFTQLLWETAKLVAPIFGITLLAGLIANYAQVGIMFNPGLMKIDFKKLDPLQGLKRMFSLRSLVDLIKTMLKIVITSSIVFWVIWSKKHELILIGEKSIIDSSRLVGTLIIQMGFAAAGSMIVLAAADFLYQKFEHEKKLKMSKQEIKEEFKKMEGDPFVKGQRRAKQREMSMNRMMQEVPRADVLITNPTHYAIAILYDQKTMDAPQVIAKGKDYIALKMKELAKEHKIMTVENKPLARALYASVDIGETVPEELFHAVGEILAYVYFQEGRHKGMMN